MLSRRELIKLGALSGSGVLLGEKATELLSKAEAAAQRTPGFYPRTTPKTRSIRFASSATPVAPSR